VPKRSGDLAMLMKRLAGRHTLYLNRRLKRTGTAWEDRFKSNPIVTDLYLLACSRYVDLNPVRAGIVRAPEDYRWSSFRERSGRSPAPWLDEDPAFLALGNSREERERRYDAWVRSTINAVETDEIRTAFERGLTLGTSGPNPSRTRIETDLPFPLHRGRT
jgi:putative transposase